MSQDTSSAVPPFYEPPAGELGEPGTLLRSEAIPGPGGSQAWRLLYVSSQGAACRVVSALAAVPTGAPPSGGWPVVSIGHTTTGAARTCAPSLDPFGAPTPAGCNFFDWMLRPFAEAGMVAVATDYRGLGTPGPHPYLAGELEAMDLLDAARAVRRLEPRAGAETLLWGHSQGGQAAACAAEAAPTYAPELAVRGAVCAAPAVELVELLGSGPTSDKPSPATGVLMMAVWGWAAVYPDIDLEALLTPKAHALLPVLAQQCLPGVVQAFGEVPPNSLFTHGLDASPWPELFARNTPGNRKCEVPLLVTQGEADTVIPAVLTAQFVARLQQAGDVVAYRTYPGIDHFGLVHTAMADSLAWLNGRLAAGGPS
jgi:pimeloyl-ACP methyl ester carboxylesterase